MLKLNIKFEALQSPDGTQSAAPDHSCGYKDK